MSVSVAREAANGSVPPQNIEAEASVLGSILLTEQALDGLLVDVGLRPEHFYRPRHVLIFRSMMRLQGEGGARGGRRAHRLRRPRAHRRAGGGRRAPTTCTRCLPR